MGELVRCPSCGALDGMHHLHDCVVVVAGDPYWPRAVFDGKHTGRVRELMDKQEGTADGP